MRRPTILDVAREAGVSKSTVSLVLQGSPLVKESTRQAVRRAMAGIGYVYNRSAAKLRAGGAGLVGLIINDLRNPFFSEFATSAQMAFASHGFATVVANTDEDPVLQAQVVDSMIEHGVSALVISPAYGGDGTAFDRIERAGTPAMQVLRRVDSRAQLFPFAAPDYAAGGRLAARHLLELGVRRLAIVGGLPDRPVTRERREGVLELAMEFGVEPVVVEGRPTRAFGRETARRLRTERPEVEAAVCFSDTVALGMLAGFQEMGLRVGRDFRLVGFDGIEECALVWPQLSSVSCDIAAFGAEAAATMLRWLETGERPPAERRSPVSLAARASSLGE